MVVSFAAFVLGYHGSVAWHSQKHLRRRLREWWSEFILLRPTLMNFKEFPILSQAVLLPASNFSVFFHYVWGLRRLSDFFTKLTFAWIKHLKPSSLSLCRHNMQIPQILDQYCVSSQKRPPAVSYLRGLTLWVVVWLFFRSFAINYCLPHLWVRILVTLVSVVHVNCSINISL